MLRAALLAGVEAIGLGVLFQVSHQDVGATRGQMSLLGVPALFLLLLGGQVVRRELRELRWDDFLVDEPQLELLV